ncbi:DUF3047 domain-containing protein [Psychromonas sp. Urea-02u-13]|uniref:DUF3047 domain-containing protein n=1 Tax=Psychromonas sp. Urea-02u-13 TaxID=2058326 RepID=UPI000C32AA7D|nr:DUF3047 domain-containing protein [Psychromonas sp. Urea-02u-13]PKG37759.1 hypothetical protein CXF74_17065 [Psychromonas sp. Urea-02u-13]
MYKKLLLLLTITTCINVNANNSVIPNASINLTSLSENGIEQWQDKVFSGKSIYTVEEYQGKLALKASSDNAASGLVLEKQIDLMATPHLNWSWLAENKLQGLDERSKSGDDFVARIYVVIDGGLWIWRTKSLSYVWSSNQAQGLVWDNAFAGDSVKMMSVRGKEANMSQWFQEKRNVFQDLIDTFGDKGSEQANREAYQYIDVIAIMTDTDNSGKKAQAYYGDLIFTQD